MTARLGSSRLVSWLTASALALSVLAAGHVPAAAAPDWVAPDQLTAWPDAPAATARAYLLLDVDSGQVLAARDPDRLLPVASTVKLLTILTALRTLQLDDVVTVGEEVDVGGAGVGLAPGDQWTVEQLVDAVLVRSGNDAAYALAAAASDGDLDAFTAEMENVAADLGAPGVVITEPTGLDDQNRLSARHLGTIARAVLADAGLATSAAQEAVDLPGLGVQPTRNLLLGSYPGADGLKTGHTDLSGWSLVGSATREAGSLVAVVLGARDDADRFDEATALLDLAYDELSSTPLLPLRLRRAGGWVSTDAPGRAWHPPGTTAEGRLSGTASAPTLVVDADSQTLTTVPLPAEPATDPAASVGQALTDALYRGMRAGHRQGRWPATGAQDVG